jgi:hypothetical protein
MDEKRSKPNAQAREKASGHQCTSQDRGSPWTINKKRIAQDNSQSKNNHSYERRNRTILR